MTARMANIRKLTPLCSSCASCSNRGSSTCGASGVATPGFSSWVFVPVDDIEVLPGSVATHDRTHVFSAEKCRAATGQKAVHMTAFNVMYVTLQPALDSFSGGQR